MGGVPLLALAIVGMPVNKLPLDTIKRILEGGESICAKAAFRLPAAIPSTRSSRFTVSSPLAWCIRTTSSAIPAPAPATS
jgi:hypothetical protein